MTQPPSVVSLFDQLLDAYGPQHWWPAESDVEVILGAILVQNTRWENVELAMARLKQAVPLQPDAIAALMPEMLAEYIRPAGFFRQKSRYIHDFCHFLQQQGGIKGLQSMPTEALRGLLLQQRGIGEETADSILLYAMHRPVFVVDAYTRRILTRMGLLEDGLSYADVQQALLRELPAEAGLFAEYHALLVEHAKRSCRKQPCCSGCVLRHDCNYAIAVSP